MTWTFILLLGAAAYSLKLVGAVLIGQRAMPAVLQRCLLLIPAALLSALIAKDTFTQGQSIVLGARPVGLAVAAFLSWKRAPFALIVVAGVGATAIVRAVA